MNLEDMNTNKFYNVLCNLNDMESIYEERYQDAGCYEELETYRKFLDNFFIKNNSLSDIYFPIIEGVEGIGTDGGTLESIRQLNEIQQIYSDLDINIVKQFNFPCQSLHEGSCFECVYVFQGSAEFWLLDKKFQLQPGDFFFHAPGDAYAVNAATNSIVINMNMRRSYIYKAYPRLFSQCPLALNFFDRCFRKEAPGNYMIFHTDNRAELKETVLRIFIEYLWGDQFRNEIIRANFEMLTAYLKRYTGDLIETLEVLSSLDRNFNDILNYLNKNYTSASLETTAEAMHFSKQHVSRIIREVTGKSFSKLLKEIRIEKVKEYLKETSLSLENIAELTGFSSTSYLWRTFKDLSGTAPSDYRREE